MAGTRFGDLSIIVMCGDLVEPIILHQYHFHKRDCHANRSEVCHYQSSRQLAYNLHRQPTAPLGNQMHLPACQTRTLYQSPTLTEHLFTYRPVMHEQRRYISVIYSWLEFAKWPTITRTWYALHTPKQATSGPQYHFCNEESLILKHWQGRTNCVGRVTISQFAFAAPHSSVINQ